MVVRPSGKPLSPWIRKRDGRAYVSICVRGKRLTRGVHQVVAEAFLGPRPDDHEINHIDGDKTNNQAANLEYVTHAENCAHATRMGLTPPPPPLRGTRNPTAKLTEEEVRDIRRRRDAGDSYQQIAADFNVCTSTVDYIVRRVYWRHVA